jgi:hypothetical protein
MPVTSLMTNLLPNLQTPREIAFLRCHIGEREQVQDRKSARPQKSMNFKKQVVDIGLWHMLQGSDSINQVDRLIWQRYVYSIVMQEFIWRS